MNYQNTLTYSCNSVPMFQHIGGTAYKEGLENTQVLDKHFRHPRRSLRTTHVAGTNGKGSCSHTLTAILQEAGYRMEFYTFPHLVDFHERIHVSGQPISEECVVDFVEKERDFFEPLHPLFFELTAAVTLRHFAGEKADVAVMEVGLGDRLDCTNIVHPGLCIITNISFDHVQFLGDTLVEIVGEKAGITKANIPVVIGETTPEAKPVFLQRAAEEEVPIIFAEDMMKNGYPKMKTELQGLCQTRNTRTILAALPLLKGAGYQIDEQSIYSGFVHVCELTGLMGRWQRLQDAPTLICDTGHNVGDITYIVEQLKQQAYRQFYIVTDMVNDKNISGALSLLPKDATYYFTKANVKRVLPTGEPRKLAVQSRLQGSCYPDVSTAITAAQEKSHPENFIFVDGSNFIATDLLANHNVLNLH